MLTSRQPRTLRDRLQLAAFALVVLVITLAGAMHVGGSDSSPFKHLFGDDLVPSYMAGTFVREGRPDLLHDYAAAQRFQADLRRIADLEQHGRTGPWLNPPFYAAVFVPLSALPYRAALWTWFGLNVLMLSAAILLLYRMLPADKRRPTDGAIIAALVVFSMPALQAMACQQNTFLSLLILCGAITLARADRPFAAGAIGALLLFKPQLAVIICGALVCTLGWRALAGMAVTAFMLIGATLLLMPGVLGDYLHKLPALLPTLRTDRPYAWERQTTFLGFWRLLLGGRTGGPNPPAVTILWIIGAASVALLLARSFWRSLIVCLRTSAVNSTSEPDLGRSQARDRLLAATIAASPLLMPYYMDYDLLLLAVPAVLLATERMRTGRQADDGWLIAGWVAVYVCMYVNAALADATGVSVIVLLMLVRFLMPVRPIWRDTAIPGQGHPARVSPAFVARFQHGRGARATLLSVCLPLAVATLAVLLAITAGVLDHAAPLTFGHDLIPSYTGGRMVIEGRAAELYDVAATRSVGRTVIEGHNLTKDSSHVLWINPPAFALVFAPLAVFPYRVALLVWLGLNAALATAAFRVILRSITTAAEIAPRAAGKRAICLILAALTSCPFLLAVEHQQNTFLSLAVLVAAVAAWRGSRPMLAGLLVGLLAYKPQLAIAVGLVLWVCEGRRALAGMLVSGLTLLAAGELIMPGATFDFLTKVPANAAYFQHHPGYNWGRQMTPTAFLRTLFGADSQIATVVGHAVSAGILVVVGWSAYRLRHRGDPGQTADSNRTPAIALAFLAMPLCAPYFMDYDLLLMVIPMSLLLKGGRTTWVAVCGLSLWLLAYLNVDLVAAMRVNGVVLLLLVIVVALIRGLTRGVRSVGVEDLSPRHPLSLQPACP